MMTVGFSFTFICFPLRERRNWIWGRLHSVGLFCIGPIRIGFRREVAQR